MGCVAAAIPMRCGGARAEAPAFLISRASPPAFLARNAREPREVFTMSAFAAQCRDAREPACTARYGTRIAQSAPPEFRVRAQRR